MFVTYFSYTVNIATVSYQYCSYLYYCKIHQCRYIHWYCALNYNDFVIFIMFYFKMSQNFAFLTQIESVHLCYFWTQQFCSRQRNSLFSIFDPQQQVQRSSSWYHTKQPLKDGALSGLDDSCEKDLDSDLNILYSGNFWKYTNVPSQCEQFPWTWTWCILYFNCWSHFENLHGGV